MTPMKTNKLPKLDPKLTQRKGLNYSMLGKKAK